MGDARCIFVRITTVFFVQHFLFLHCLVGDGGVLGAGFLHWNIDILAAFAGLGTAVVAFLEGFAASVWSGRSAGAGRGIVDICFGYLYLQCCSSGFGGFCVMSGGSNGCALR